MGVLEMSGDCICGGEFGGLLVLGVRKEFHLVLDCVCEWDIMGFGDCNHLLCGPGHVRCKLRDIIIIMSYVVRSVIGIDAVLSRDIRSETWTLLNESDSIDSRRALSFR